MAKRTVSVAILCVVLGTAFQSSGRIEEEHQPDDTSDCIASWDPFCPAGTPTENGDDEDDWQTYCMECKWVENGPRCRQVAQGQTGREGCTVVWVELVPTSCKTHDAFCENITITP
jgi:hypothetical protein